MKYIVMLLILSSCCVIRHKRSSIPQRRDMYGFSTKVTTPAWTTQQMRDSISKLLNTVKTLQQSQRMADTMIFRDKNGTVTFRDTIYVNTIIAQEARILGRKQVDTTHKN